MRTTSESPRFCAMYFRKKTSGGRAYLQIVESRREGAAVRQQVIATLGRIEDLRESGQLERLLRSGARFADKAIVVDALDRGEAAASAARRIGPALAFERLWEETGCREVVERLASARKHDFSLERAVFLTVLHRLFSGGSDRAADRWREDYRIEGAEGLELHHLYRAMAWLGEELAEDQQDGATPFAPRCLKDVMEEELFARRRDLFSTLDLVFMDTTSLYFEGAGGQTLGRRGFSKDHRPDLNQMILAVLLDGDGRPVCTEMWPGNTADVEQPDPGGRPLQRPFDQPGLRRRRSRHDQRRDDRRTGGARAALHSGRARAHRQARARTRARRSRALRPVRSDEAEEEIDYEAKAVTLAGRRYIVCRNRDEMKKDAAARAAILAALERQLKKGDKSLVGNKGYRRFLANPQATAFAIDRAKAEEDAKFDGVFVLRTNAHLSPLEAMLVYKQLWTVERAFRTSKSLFETRPIFHKLDETIRGHVSCSFLALVLKKELEDRIAAVGQRRPRLLARYPRRPQLADRDRGRTGRQAISPALRPAPRRQPRALRRRRRPAAHRAPARPTPDPTPKLRNVVPRPRCSALLRMRSMAWLLQLLKISLTRWCEHIWRKRRLYWRSLPTKIVSTAVFMLS